MKSKLILPIIFIFIFMSSYGYACSCAPDTIARTLNCEGEDISPALDNYCSDMLGCSYTINIGSITGDLVDSEYSDFLNAVYTKAGDSYNGSGQIVVEADGMGGTDYLYLNYAGTACSSKIGTEPNATLFSTAYGTTDFSEIEDYTNVSNLTLATAGGKVRWVDNQNVSGLDFDDNVVIGQAIASLNLSALNEGLNSTADVSMNLSAGTSCSGFTLYYADEFYNTSSEIVDNGVLIATSKNIGGDCIDSSICSNVTCSNGVLNFTAEHFDGFGEGGNGTYPNVTLNLPVNGGSFEELINDSILFNFSFIEGSNKVQNCSLYTNESGSWIIEDTISTLSYASSGYAQGNINNPDNAYDGDFSTSNSVSAAGAYQTYTYINYTEVYGDNMVLRVKGYNYNNTFSTVVSQDLKAWNYTSETWETIASGSKSSGSLCTGDLCDYYDLNFDFGDDFKLDNEVQLRWHTSINSGGSTTYAYLSETSITTEGLPNSTDMTFGPSTYSEGNYVWNVECVDNSSFGDFGDDNWTFSVDDYALPNVTLLWPDNDSTFTQGVDDNIQFNFSVIYGSYPLSNCSLYGDFDGTWEKQEDYLVITGNETADSYDLIGTWSGGSSTYDGNWDTSGYIFPSGDTQTLFANYSIPEGTTSANYTWKVQTYNNHGFAYYCWDGSTWTGVNSISGGHQVTYLNSGSIPSSCLDNPDRIYQVKIYPPSTRANQRLYEENVTWVLEVPLNNSVSSFDNILLSPGEYNWNVECIDDNGLSSFGENNQTFTVNADTTPPSINQINDNGSINFTSDGGQVCGYFNVSYGIQTFEDCTEWENSGYYDYWYDNGNFACGSGYLSVNQISIPAGSKWARFNFSDYGIDPGHIEYGFSMTVLSNPGYSDISYVSLYEGDSTVAVYLRYGDISSTEAATEVAYHNGSGWTIIGNGLATSVHNYSVNYYNSTHFIFYIDGEYNGTYMNYNTMSQEYFDSFKFERVGNGGVTEYAYLYNLYGQPTPCDESECTDDNRQGYTLCGPSSDKTPTIRFTTDENANCRFSNLAAGYNIDQAYVVYDDSYTYSYTQGDGSYNSQSIIYFNYSIPSDASNVFWQVKYNQTPITTNFTVIDYVVDNLLRVRYRTKRCNDDGLDCNNGYAWLEAYNGSWNKIFTYPSTPVGGGVQSGPSSAYDNDWNTGVRAEGGGYFSASAGKNNFYENAIYILYYMNSSMNCSTTGSTEQVCTQYTDLPNQEINPMYIACCDDYGNCQDAVTSDPAYTFNYSLSYIDTNVSYGGSLTNAEFRVVNLTQQNLWPVGQSVEETVYQEDPDSWSYTYLGQNKFYWYINYTIPDASIGSNWRIKIGTLDEQNITNIEDNCSQAGGLYQFRLISWGFYASNHQNRESYAECYNGAGWTTLLQDSAGTYGSISGTGTGAEVVDGNWATRDYAEGGGLKTGGDPHSASLYEEGIYWLYGNVPLFNITNIGNTNATSLYARLDSPVSSGIEMECDSSGGFNSPLLLNTTQQEINITDIEKIIPDGSQGVWCRLNLNNPESGHMGNIYFELTE